MPALSAGVSLASLWAVFLVGLAGGFGHCIVMCGPIAASAGVWSGTAATARDDSGAGPGAGASTGGRTVAVALWQAAFQGGRVLTYTLIGAAVGGLGSLAAVRGALGPVQRVVWLVSGEVLIVMGLAIAGVPLVSRLGRGIEEGWAKAVRPRLERPLRALLRSGPAAALPLGMLLGLMPCGFLMSIEIYAVGTGSALAGAATMAAFGLGTVPALLASGAVGGVLGARRRAWLMYAGAAIVVALGVFYVVRAVGSLLPAGG